jgi:hypothetical protein
MIEFETRGIDRAKMTDIILPVERERSAREMKNQEQLAEMYREDKALKTALSAYWKTRNDLSKAEKARDALCDLEAEQETIDKVAELASHYRKAVDGYLDMFEKVWALAWQDMDRMTRLFGGDEIS